MWRYSCVCMYVRMCVGMCEFATERRKGCRVSSSQLSRLFTKAGSLMEPVPCWLGNSGKPVFCGHDLPLYTIFAHKCASGHTVAFTWVLGIQTLVQVLAQHSFCPLSYLLGSSQLIFWRTHSLFVCLRHTNKKRNKQANNPELMRFIPGGSLDNKNLAWATTEEKNTLQKWKYLGGMWSRGYVSRVYSKLGCLEIFITAMMMPSWCVSQLVEYMIYLHEAPSL